MMRVILFVDRLPSGPKPHYDDTFLDTQFLDTQFLDTQLLNGTSKIRLKRGGNQILLNSQLFNAIRKDKSIDHKINKIQKLLRQGANINAKDANDNDNSPLHIAVAENAPEIVQLLLDYGADEFATNKNGKIPLQLTDDREIKDIFRLKNAEPPRKKVKLGPDFEPMEIDHDEFRTEREYPASGLKNTLHGDIFQLKLCMVYLLQGLQKKLEFRVATEMDAAEKFDDLVFSYKENGRVRYKFLQAKHKQDESTTIDRNDLIMEGDGEFSLRKYFLSHRKMKANPYFKNAFFDEFIITTNIDLKAELKDKFEALTAKDNFIDFSENKKEFMRYKIFDDLNHPFTKKIAEVFRETSDLNRLAKNLAECTLKPEKQINLANQIFKEYQMALIEEKVVADGKLHPDFIDDNNLSGVAQELRGMFQKEYAKMKKIKTEAEAKNIWNLLKGANLNMSKGFTNVFRLDPNPIISDEQGFADAIGEAILKAGPDNSATVRRENRKAGVISENIEKLAGHVLVIENENGLEKIKFRPGFLDTNAALPGNLQNFKSRLIIKLNAKGMQLGDLSKFDFHINNFKTCEDGRQSLKYSLPIDTVSDAEISDFLSVFKLHVNTPNEQELEPIIKTKIGRNFHSADVDNVYSRFQSKMLKWMADKKGTFLTNDDGASFFENLKLEAAKSVYFKVGEPIGLFAGRNVELEALHDNIKSKRLVITGLGGVGKTQLVRRYVQKYSENYESIIWIDATNKDTIGDSFLELSKTSKLRIAGDGKHIDTVVSEVYDAFRGMGKSALFIFDGASNLQGTSKYLNYAVDKFSFIITSRNQNWGTFTQQHVECFSNEDSEMFIRTALDIPYGIHDSEISTLSETMDHFPLALHQSVANIRENVKIFHDMNKVSLIEKYIRDFQIDKKTLLEYIPPENVGVYSKSTLTTWKETFDTIGSSEFGQNALEILHAMAYFNPRNIPPKLKVSLEEHFGKTSSLKPVVENSMVENKKGTLAVNKLVQETTRLDLKERNLEPPVLTKVLDFLSNSLGKDTILHAQTAWELASLHETLLRKYGQFPASIVDKLEKMGSYKEAILFGEKAINILQTELGNDYPDVLNIKNSVASALNAQGNFQRAYEISKEVYDIRMSTDINVDIKGRNNLGIALMGLEDYEGAYAVFSDLQSNIGKGGMDHNSLTVLNNLGMLFDKTGEPQKAINIFMTILSSPQILFPEVHFIQNNYATALFNNKQFDEASNIFRRAYDGLRTDINFGREHVKTLVAMQNCGSALAASGKYEEAKSMYSQVLEIQGQQSVDTLNTKSNMANVLFAIGEHEKAIAMHQEVYEETIKLLGPDHPKTLGYQEAIRQINNYGLEHNLNLPLNQCFSLPITRRKRSPRGKCLDSEASEQVTEERDERLKNLFDTDTFKEKVKYIELYDHLLTVSQQISRGEEVDPHIEGELIKSLREVNLDLIHPDLRETVKELQENVREKEKFRSIFKSPMVTEKIEAINENVNKAFAAFFVGKHLLHADGKGLSMDAVNLIALPAAGDYVASKLFNLGERFGSKSLKFLSSTVGRGISNFFAFYGLEQGIEGRINARTDAEKNIADLNIITNTIFIASDFAAAVIGPFALLIPAAAMLVSIFWEPSLEVDAIAEQIDLVGSERSSLYWKFFWGSKLPEYIEDDITAKHIFKQHIEAIISQFKDNYDIIIMTLPYIIVSKTNASNIGFDFSFPTRISYPFKVNNINSRIIESKLDDFSRICGPSDTDISINKNTPCNNCAVGETQDTWYLKQYPTECLNAVAYKHVNSRGLGGMFRIESNAANIHVDQPAGVYRIKRDTRTNNVQNVYYFDTSLKSCTVINPGTNIFYTSGKFSCNFGTVDQRNIIIMTHSNLVVDSTRVDSIYGTEGSDKIEFSNANYVDGKGGLDTIIAKNMSNIRGYYGDFISGGLVLLPMRLANINKLVFVDNSTKIYKGNQFIRTSPETILKTQDELYIFPTKVDNKTNLITNVLIKKYVRENIDKELKHLRTININGVLTTKQLIGPNYFGVLVGDHDSHMFYPDKEVNTIYWEAPSNASHHYFFEDMTSNVTIAQANGLLDFVNVNTALEVMQFFIDSEDRIVIINKNLTVTLLPGHKDLRMTVDGRSFFKIEGAKIKTERCTHKLEVNGLYHVNNHFLDYINCFVFQSDKIVFLKLKKDLILLSSQSLLTISNYYSSVHKTKDLSIRLANSFITPVQFEKRAEHFNSTLYYKPSSGLSIFHNQPINKFAVGLIDLKDKSILDFDLDIVDENLIVSNKNETFLTLYNWDKFQKAREIMIFFNDTTIYNSECVVSTCTPEDILTEFYDGKESVSKLKAVRNRRQVKTLPDQEERPAKSCADKKSAWISDIVSWAKRSVLDLYTSYSKTYLVWQNDVRNAAASHNKVHTISSLNKGSSSRTYNQKLNRSMLEMGDKCFSEIDLNGGILLADVYMARRNKRKIFSSSEHRQLSFSEALSYGLNLIELFKEAVVESALECGISQHRLNFNRIDYSKLEMEIAKYIEDGDFGRIFQVLSSNAESICPGVGKKQPGRLSEKKLNSFLNVCNRKLDFMVGSLVVNTTNKVDSNVSRKVVELGALSLEMKRLNDRVDMQYFLE